MKLTDLAILDWVLINNTPHKIQAIDSIDAEILADDDLYYVGEDRCHSEDKIEPIPLTIEILEKNGWWYEIEDIWLHDKVSFCIEKWNGKFQCYDISQIKLDSVHQLQQILRLCGLNELADNFKVYEK